MKTVNLFCLLAFTTIGVAAFHTNGIGETSALDSKSYSFEVSGASAKSVLELVARKANLEADFEGDFQNKVSYNFEKTTLRDALDSMAKDVGFTYSLNNGKLAFSQSSGGGRSLASSSGGDSIRMLELKFVDADEMATKIKPLLASGEDVYVDKALNTLAISASEATHRKVAEFTNIFDRLPNQIMIEARIVETNNNFSRELGFLAGDLSDQTMNNDSKVTGLSTPNVAATPFFRAKYRVGIMNNRALDLRLIAAETKGDAKVISRPKVVTINNTRAVINSGLIFNVKTLTNQSSTNSDGSTSAVTGGLQQVEAGLQLGVLPSIVNSSLIRLLVEVNNSEPENTISVDGIPGISTNSANTSIIVENGNTAVIAGLIKNSKSNGRTGVPFLSDIPILGMLFRSDASSERNNELVILITPKIMANPSELEKAVATEETKEIAKNLEETDSGEKPSGEKPSED
jgi:type IV pilus assembly protein PilQ